MILEKFANENKNKKLIADFGCGPGQTTAFLKKCGLKKIIGIDISPEMVKKARSLNKGIKFVTGNILKLEYDNNYFSSAVAFYAIVHFNYIQLKKALKEINRVLEEKGQFLFSFHAGNKSVHLENFLNQNVKIDFYFFNTEKVLRLLEDAGFKIILTLERFSDPLVEHASKRAYILAEKI